VSVRPGNPNVAGQDDSAKNTTFDAQVQQLSLLPLSLFQGK
jgi:hypothetical protein